MAVVAGRLCLKLLCLALPGIAATFLFGFLVGWNHYLFSMGLTITPDMFTLPVGIAALSGEFRVAWNELMAGTLIASLPALILYLLLQKWFVRGFNCRCSQRVDCPLNSLLILS